MRNYNANLPPTPRPDPASSTTRAASDPWDGSGDVGPNPTSTLVANSISLSPLHLWEDPEQTEPDSAPGPSP
jgi:hypothetical protein